MVYVPMFVGEMPIISWYLLAPTYDLSLINYHHHLARDHHPKIAATRKKNMNMLSTTCHYHHFCRISLDLSRFCFTARPLGLAASWPSGAGPKPGPQKVGFHWFSHQQIWGLLWIGDFTCEKQCLSLLLNWCFGPLWLQQQKGGIDHARILQELSR